MNGLEKITHRLLWWQMGWLAIAVAATGVIHLAAGLDWLAELMTPSGNSVIAECLLALILFALGGLVLEALWSRTLWQTLLPGRERAIWCCWLIFIPFAGVFFRWAIWWIFARKRDGRSRRAVLSWGVLLLVAGIGTASWAAPTGICGGLLGDTPTPAWMWIVRWIGAAAAIGQVALQLLCIQRLSTVSWTRAERWTLGSIAALFMVTLITPYAMTLRLNRRIANAQTEIRALGGAVNLADLKQDYYRSGPADPEWAAMLSGEWLSGMENAEAEAPDWAKLRSQLADRREKIVMLDRLVEQRKNKYALDFDVSMTAALQLPQLAPQREISRLYETRIRLALRDGDAQTAKRLYWLSEHFLYEPRECSQIGTMVKFHLRATHVKTLSALLAAQVFSIAELDEVVAGLRKMECDAYPAIKYGFSREVAMTDCVAATRQCSGDLPMKSRPNVSPLLFPGGVWLFNYLQNEELFMLRYWVKALQELNREENTQANIGIFLQKKNIMWDVTQFRERLFAGMLLPDLPAGWVRAGDSAGLARMGIVGCEIERFRQTHGRLPKSLTELPTNCNVIDPLSGRPFGYRQGELTFHRAKPGKPTKYDAEKRSGWMLYGVGRNWKDDGGHWGMAAEDCNDTLFVVASPSSR